MSGRLSILDNKAEKVVDDDPNFGYNKVHFKVDFVGGIEFA